MYRPFVHVPTTYTSLNMRKLQNTGQKQYSYVRKVNLKEFESLNTVFKLKKATKISAYITKGYF